MWLSYHNAKYFYSQRKFHMAIKVASAVTFSNDLPIRMILGESLYAIGNYTEAHKVFVRIMDHLLDSNRHISFMSSHDELFTKCCINLFYLGDLQYVKTCLLLQPKFIIPRTS